jgi:putative effector of murein hydrolase LrgA (UPF0299 family)
VEVADGDQVLVGMPSWCRLLVLVPVVVAGLTLLGGGAQDPYVVLMGVVVSSWVTGALARWALVRQGRPGVVARRWVDEGLKPGWVLWPMVAFGVWVTVDVVRTATSPAGDWWDWAFVVFLGLVWLFGVAMAVDAFKDWRRRRAS